MKKTPFALSTLSAWAAIVAAQPVNSSGQASASGNTSVSAGRSGANVQSDTNANTSSRAGDPKEAKKPKPSGHSTDPKNRSAAAGGLAAGTTVNAVLAKSLDSGRSKPGDLVVATAAQDVKADGKVVIRRGSHLIGHVTEAKPRGKGETNASLGIVLDHAVLKDGQQLPMNSVVQALAAARTQSSSSDDSLGAVKSGGISRSGSASGGGPLGGVTSAARTTTSTVGNVGGSATGAVHSTLGSTANVGGGLDGALSSTSSRVIGLKNLSLAGDAANSTEGSLIISPGKSVHLDSGTQMVLRVVDR